MLEYNLITKTGLKNTILKAHALRLAGVHDQSAVRVDCNAVVDERADPFFANQAHEKHSTAARQLLQPVVQVDGKRHFNLCQVVAPQI